MTFAKLFYSLLLSSYLIPSNGINTIGKSILLPLDNKPLFSGSFGELRKNHFHTGLDFRTNGHTGLPVYAVQGGMIIRVSVSPVGYGRAMYLSHPDGTTTVYGHLSKFNSKIESFVLQEQYNHRNFAVDLNIPAGKFTVNQGDIIAWSGNSGSSGGPHLHFEIRETLSEKPLNPLLYLPGIKDNSSPKINAIYIYALNNESYVGKNLQKIRLDVTKASGNTKLSTPYPIELFGSIGFGIQCDDDFNGEGMKCGIYSADLLLDNKKVFAFKMDHLDFEQGRSVNSHIDYKELIDKRRWVHRLYLQPGNNMDIYQKQLGTGILKIDDNKAHIITVITADAYGNTNTCQFKVLSKKKEISPPELNYTKVFEYDHTNEFENDELKIYLSKGVLFDQLKFRYRKIDQSSRFLSNIHQIHSPEVPVNSSYKVSIKTKKISSRLAPKTILAIIDTKGGLNPVGGDYFEGWMTAMVKQFGNFVVVADTIPPVIRKVRLPDMKDPKDDDSIVFKISDNLSGISEYEGLIDNKWVLFEYDAKSGTLTYNLDKSRVSLIGEHSLILTVKDQVKNTSVFKTVFKYK